jgi:peptide/nickel transport system permease protein
MTAVEDAATAAAETRATPRVRRRGRRLSRELLVLALPAAILAVFVVWAIVPGLFAPHDPIAQSLIDRNLPPFSHSSKGGLHILGTDPLGRDILSRLIYGTRVALGVGISSVLVSSLIGVPLGIVAGYRGGRTETVIMRLVDGMLSFPVLVLAIFFLYVAGPGVLNLIIVVALMRWMVYSRVARGLTLSYRDAAFVEAARSVGCGSARIMFRHILPNILSPLLVLATLEVAAVILTEASLSFLGLGVQPPTPSWGLMISDGRNYLRDAWWGIAFPGLAILLVTLSLNLVASWARRASDPGAKFRFVGVRRRDLEA